MGTYVVSAFVTVVAASLIWACGTSKDASTENLLACKTPGEETVRIAVAKYIREVSPTPHRFLVAAGTDSAVGDGGFRALQDKGPTYLFPADTAQQAKVREKLAQVGGYTTLLVALKNKEKLDDTTAVIKLRGTYVGAENDGDQAEEQEIKFSCRYANWELKDPSNVIQM